MDDISRHQAVLRQLDIVGQVTAPELADRFGVSLVTVRKDLHTLEGRGALRRVRGGAVARTQLDEGAFEVRRRFAREQKEAVATAAAAVVSPGDTIVIDASTTGYHLARELVDVQNLVVITNGMRTGMLLMEQSTAMVIMAGGEVRRAAGSLVGRSGAELAGRGRVDHGFFGVKGVCLERGLLDAAEEEAAAKRGLADICAQVHGIFDATKLPGSGEFSFAAPGRITSLFTDTAAAPDLVEAWRDRGVSVVPAEARPADGVGGS